MSINKKANRAYILRLIVMAAVLVAMFSILGVSKTIFDNQTESELRKDLARVMHIKNSQSIPTYPEDIPVSPIRNTIRWEDPEQIKRELAYDMLRCWDDFGRGKWNVFPSERLTKENYCYICSYIDFKHEDVGVKGFKLYLMEHKPVNSKITFWEDFYGKPPSQSEIDFATKVANDSINTSLKYASLFAFEKKTGFFDKKTAGLIGGGGTMAVISIAGLFIPGVGWAVTAVTAVGAGLAVAIYGVIEAPMGIPADYSGGVILTPFESEALLELHCTKLGS